MVMTNAVGLSINPEPVIAANEHLGAHGYMEEAYTVRGRTGALYYTALSGMGWLEHPPEELGDT
jgi:hypothetical protein